MTQEKFFKKLSDKEKASFRSAAIDNNILPDPNSKEHASYLKRLNAYYNCCLSHPRRATSLARTLGFSNATHSGHFEGFKMEFADNFQSWKTGVLKSERLEQQKKGGKRNKKTSEKEELKQELEKVTS